MQKIIQLATLAFAGFWLTTPAQAFNIHLTYDSSVTGLTNAAQVEAAAATAAAAFTNQFTNAITVNITVYWGATGPFTNGIGLGASYSSSLNSSYHSVVAALTSHRVSAADFSSVASLPASDPVNATNWWVPQAEVKALGLPGATANDTNEDGAVGFDSGTTYTFDPANRAVAGKMDFIGVVEHEISEVLGRTYLLNVDGSGGYAPYDLFRFKAAGTRSMDTNAAGAYFSVDNGATVLKFFQGDINAGDIQDWVSSTPPDAFDAAVSAGFKLVLSATDITALDVLGYNAPATATATSPRLTGVMLTNGAVQFSFTNTPGVSFTVLASTNVSLSVSNWTVLGGATENPAGQYHFTDPQSATNHQRYYRVRSP